jgi:hypothetical protein
MEEKKGGIRRPVAWGGQGGSDEGSSHFEWEELDRPPNLVFSLLIPHPSLLFYYLLFIIRSYLGTCLATPSHALMGVRNQSRFVNGLPRLPRLVSSNLPRLHLSTSPFPIHSGEHSPLRERKNITMYGKKYWMKKDDVLILHCLKHDRNLFV